MRIFGSTPLHTICASVQTIFDASIGKNIRYKISEIGKPGKMPNAISDFVDLGAQHAELLDLLSGDKARSTENRINKILQDTRSGPSRMFLICWTGTRMPIGLELLGTKIGWMKNGKVFNDRNQEIGNYKSLTDNPLAHDADQVLLVSISLQSL